MLTRRTLLAILAAVAMAGRRQALAGDRLTIFAAASLKNALDAITAAWAAESGKEVAISYAASSALARQIAEGAPADIFFSADLDWMNTLVEEKLVAAGSAINLLGNEIVLIAPADSAIATRIEKGFPLADLLGDGRLAMADVKAVPAGKYGRAALETLGVWSSVETRIAQAENVRAALKLVATGEAPLGIVYATDARAEPSVKVIGTFPATSHPPIVYPVAVLTSSANPDAAALLAFLQSARASSIFTAQGFTVLTPQVTD